MTGIGDRDFFGLSRGQSQRHRRRARRLRHGKALTAARRILGGGQRGRKAQQANDESNNAQHGICNRALFVITLTPNSAAVMAVAAHVWADAQGDRALI